MTTSHSQTLWLNYVPGRTEDESWFQEIAYSRRVVLEMDSRATMQFYKLVASRIFKIIITTNDFDTIELLRKIEAIHGDPDWGIIPRDVFENLLVNT